MKNSVSGSLFKELLTMVFSHFEIKNSENFGHFTKGVEYYTQYLFLHDRIVDNEIDYSNEAYLKEDSTFFLCHHYHQKSIIALNHVFPEDHQFWDILEGNDRIYFNGLAKEKYISKGRQDLTLKEFEELAIAKHILSVVQIRGMFFLGSTKLNYENVEKVFSLLFCGIQMLDDLDDFDKDMKEGQWNFLQSEVRAVIVSEGLNSDDTIVDLEKKVLYAAEIAEFAIDYSITKFSEASNLACEIGLVEIDQWLKQMIIEADNQKKYILSLL